MPEEILFESESTQSRTDIASYLRAVATKLEEGEAITLTTGTDSVTMTPPSQPTFEVKAEREGPEGGPSELSLEFELEWDEHGADDATGAGHLEIE